MTRTADPECAQRGLTHKDIQLNSSLFPGEQVQKGPLLTGPFQGHPQARLATLHLTAEATQGTRKEEASSPAVLVSLEAPRGEEVRSLRSLCSPGKGAVLEPKLGPTQSGRGSPPGCREPHTGQCRAGPHSPSPRREGRQDSPEGPLRLVPTSYHILQVRG